LILINKYDRIKYFEFLKANDYKGFTNWIKYLSNMEPERMKKFGYSE